MKLIKSTLLMGLVVTLAACSTKQKEEITISELYASLDVNQLHLRESKPHQFPNYCYYYPVPVGAKTFKLSQDYPKSEPVKESYPWDDIDFTKDWEKYMNSVLQYCLKGNVEVNFEGQNNQVRKWYHTPWQDNDFIFNEKGYYVGAGREYNHGLTQERTSDPGSIYRDFEGKAQTWAVGMYNDLGGYTLGQTFKQYGKEPDITKANFPEGTVTFKLLFTEATPKQVPFLENTLKWTANIYNSTVPDSITDRINKDVHLLQVDIAVKDSRASKTGWIFGTYVYDASKKGNHWYERLTPVGLSWGNDSDLEDGLSMERLDPFINNAMKENIVNENLIRTNSTKKQQAVVTHFGRGGRLTGPLDNVQSSCVSCHGQTGINQKNNSPMPLSYFNDIISMDQYRSFFGNVKAGAYERQFQNSTYFMTDYSLQIANGIRNYHNQKYILDQLNTAKSEKLNKMIEDNVVKFTTEFGQEINRMKHLPTIKR